MRGTNWGRVKLRCQQWTHSDPLQCLHTMGCSKGAKNTWVKQSTQRGLLYAQISFCPHEKGQRVRRERAGQHWGMLGRDPCSLPLECPWASYISPVRPAAAPLATHSQSAAIPALHWNNHRLKPVSASSSLRRREELWNTVIKDLCNCNMTLPQLTHT